MPTTVAVAPEERRALGFVLDRVCIFYAHGTAEQRESAQILTGMLRGLEQTPPGSVEMEFLAQDAYLVGSRVYAVATELEDFWLDAQEAALGHRLPEPEPALLAAVRHFFPEVVEEPLAWEYDEVRGIFLELGFKFDRAVTGATPRARALYNSDKEEMVDKANAVKEERALQRAQTAASQAPAAVALAEAATTANDYTWGVEVPTGYSPDDIPAESFRSLRVGSVTVFITNYRGCLAAIGGTCSHQSAGLSNGRVDGTRIQCPRHGAEFDLRNGRELCPPFCRRWMETNGAKARVLQAITPEKTGGDLPTYPLRIVEGEIVLRI